MVSPKGIKRSFNRPLNTPLCMHGRERILLGTTVFRGKRNFAPSRGICALPRKTYIAAEFRGIGYFLEKKHVLHDSALFP
jgi:hypothetical protein